MGNVTTLLFDLGGVLIELGPVSRLIESSPHDPETVWQNWVHSDSVRAFESGQADGETFARRMIEELDLDDTPASFLTRFREWPRGTFPGALELLTALRQRFTLVCLSNTNPVHYDDFLRYQQIMTCFDHTYLSHRTGVLKPDLAAFLQITRDLGTTPGEALFLDDNASNAAAAESAGFRAERVVALDGVRDALNRHGLHP